jgi:hypothetical protein
VAELDALLQAKRAAVAALIAAAEARAATSTTPRAPGKWSPSQLVEHVARAIDESANEVTGATTRFPHLPFFLKPVARTLLFNRVLKRGAFPRARTSGAFNPETGPATPAEARQRLLQALERFNEACRARAARDSLVASVVFGTVSLADYVRFQELHTRHHTKQLAS